MIYYILLLYYILLNNNTHYTLRGLHPFAVCLQRVIWKMTCTCLSYDALSKINLIPSATPPLACTMLPRSCYKAATWVNQIFAVQSSIGLPSCFNLLVASTQLSLTFVVRIEFSLQLRLGGLHLSSGGRSGSGSVGGDSVRGAIVGCSFGFRLFHGFSHFVASKDGLDFCCGFCCN